MEQGNIMKAWITKYALTSGIQEVDGEVDTSISATMFSWTPASGWMKHAHGKDWHKTREAAIARAEEMRLTKIAGLKRSIAELEKLKFE
jgi:hypothetical protein